MKAPAVDGVLSPGEWDQAVRYDSFSLFGRNAGGKPPVETSAWIGYDENNLYIAFHCANRKGIPLRLEKKETDDNISHDDSVEVFLNGAPRDNRYLQLGQSAAGVRFDALVKGGASQVDRKWTSSLWRSAAKAGPDFFEAEFAIPFRMIPCDGSGFFRFNLTRTVRGGGNAYLTLVPMSGDGWHQPEKFAVLKVPPFSEFGKVTAARIDSDSVVMGANLFRCRLTNHTKEQQSATVSICPSGVETSRTVTLEPGGGSVVEIPWKCTSPAGTFSWKLRRGGCEIFASPELSYSLETGCCSVPPVFYATRDVTFGLRVNYDRAELSRSAIRIDLRKDGRPFRTLTLPFTENPNLKRIPPGVYEAELGVRSENGVTLFQHKTRFSVVPYFL